MTDLSSLTGCLQDQFIDPASMALPQDTVTESLRQSLSEINTHLSTDYQLSGLDYSTQTTLPASLESALLLNASALLLDFALRSQLTAQDNDPHNAQSLQSLSLALKAQFENELGTHRLSQFQESADPPSFTITDPENNYDPTLDA